MKGISLADVIQVLIGILQQHIERIFLCDFSEFFTVPAANQVVEFVPFLIIMIGFFLLCYQFLSLLLIFLMPFELIINLVDSKLDFFILFIKIRFFFPKRFLVLFGFI